VKPQPFDIKAASLQAIFDFAVAHVRKQGKPSLLCDLNGGGCAMRGDGGAMCVVGAMIDDDLAEQCDGTSGGHIPSAPDSSCPEWRERVGDDGNKYTLLGELQRAHDGASSDGLGYAFLASFERSVEQTARRFKLTYTAPGAA
jgi:hypothetical protein